MSGITHLAGNGKALEGLPEGFANKLGIQYSPQVDCSADFQCAANPVAAPMAKFDMDLGVA